MKVVLDTKEFEEMAQHLAWETGLVFTPDDIDNIVFTDEILAGRIVSFGYDDTEVREELNDRVAEFLGLVSFDYDDEDFKSELIERGIALGMKRYTDEGAEADLYSFPPSEDVGLPTIHLSEEERSTMMAESEIRFFHDRRRDQELIDTLFSEEKPSDGMIVFARHASECVRSATDRDLTKQVLHFMGPIAYQPGITPELLDAVHTMMIEAYFYGRERLLAQAYDMGAGVKV